jgi:structural maintenance of chromosome 1
VVRACFGKTERFHRTRFEDEQLQARKQRLATLLSTVANEETALIELQKKKEETQTQITQAEGNLETLKSELEVISRAQDEKNTAVDVAKRAASKASKALDLALKEISVKVTCSAVHSAEIPLTARKNDEIEKLALERSSAYRKCRLENIPLPLAQGNLRDVPMEEVIRLSCPEAHTHSRSPDASRRDGDGG